MAAMSSDGVDCTAGFAGSGSAAVGNAGGLQLCAGEQGVVQKIEALHAIDGRDSVDEDEHVAGRGDLAVRVVRGLGRRLDAAYLIDGDEWALNLLHAAEDVLEVEVRALAAVVDGLFLNGHVAAQLRKVLAGLEIVGLEGGFDVAVVGDGLVRPVLLDDLREGLRNEVGFDLVPGHEAHRGGEVGNLPQLGKLVKHEQEMVTVRVELFHEAIEDELKHEPDKRTQAVAVRLRNLEVEAHRRFAINEIANDEVGTRDGLLYDWIVVQRHRGDDA